MANFEDRDRGWKRIKKEFQKNARFKDPHVAVGLRGNGPGAEQHAGGALTLVQIGALHEFGIPPMPMRSFIRAGVDSDQKAIERLVNKLAGRVAIGKLPVRDALSLVGDKGVAAVKKHMRKGIPPQKKDGDPARLKDTGQLQGAIDHEVRLK